MTEIAEISVAWLILKIVPMYYLLSAYFYAFWEDRQELTLTGEISK